MTPATAQNRTVFLVSLGVAAGLTLLWLSTHSIQDPPVVIEPRPVIIEPRPEVIEPRPEPPVAPDEDIPDEPMIVVIPEPDPQPEVTAVPQPSYRASPPRRRWRLFNR